MLSSWPQAEKRVRWGTTVSAAQEKQSAACFNNVLPELVTMVTALSTQAERLTVNQTDSLVGSNSILPRRQLRLPCHKLLEVAQWAFTVNSSHTDWFLPRCFLFDIWFCCTIQGCADIHKHSLNKSENIQTEPGSIESVINSLNNGFLLKLFF